MALITWNQGLSVNVKEIDEEHKVLINLINELHDAMMKGKSKDVIENIINELVTYTKKHFSTEEKYFKQYEYPDEKSHINQHNLFVEKVKDFQEKHTTGGAFLSIEIMEFLKDWLTNHIIGTDKKYTDFFNSKGLI